MAELAIGVDVCHQLVCWGVSMTKLAICIFLRIACRATTMVI
ncbi:hypothetical protein [Dyadobacter sp. MSC1_007]|nr:hypothetical protein [Dyadobacter sp. MSC1_007]